MVIVLLAACFTLATLFVPRAGWWNNAAAAADWNNGQSRAYSVFKLVLGRSRLLFANEMYDMADSYFHSGYYPSIFDRPVTEHDVAKSALGEADNDSTADDFLGPPPDWIAALDRQFVPNRHTHLSAGGPAGREKSSSVQEILPWLKLATDLNPHFIKGYRVGDYWLIRLHKPAEARDYLLDGLRHNPGNPALLFDLGWLYDQDFHDANRASNVWTAGLRCWNALPPDARTNTENQLVCDQLTMNLVRLAEDAGNWTDALRYLNNAKRVSPNPAAIQEQIDEARKKRAAQSGASRPQALPSGRQIKNSKPPDKLAH